MTQRPNGPLTALVVAATALFASSLAAQDTTVVQDSVLDTAALTAPPPARVVQDTTATGELQALFSRIDVLTGVAVAVEGGVARLTGTTLSHEAKATAVELASTRSDVLYVDDRIEVETSVGARVGPVISDLKETALDWLTRTPLLLAALAIVVAFAVLAEVLGSMRWLYRRFGATAFMEDLARRAIKVLVWLAGIVLALELMDATALVGALLGAAGVAGLAFGFAFRNIAENWLAGILLGLRRPFDLDDVVQVAGNQGKVVRLTHSDTVLMTVDGNHLRIPNALVYNGLVENYTRNPRRRFRLRLTLPREVDVDRAREVLFACLKEAPVLEKPAAAAPLVEVGDTHLVLELQAWVNQKEHDFSRARSIVYKTAKDALLAAGLPTPTSEHWVHMDNVDAGPATGAPAQGAAPTPATESPELDPALDEEIEADRKKSDDVNLLG